MTHTLHKIIRYEEVIAPQSELNTLPILLRNPKILLIGGGKVALQKAEVLKDNNIDFKIITINILPQFKKLDIKPSLKPIEVEDIKRFNIVINATGNKDVESLIDKCKLTQSFLLNTVDVPEKCDFYFSALLNYGKLKVAISSDGASPTISKIVRNKIKEVIPSNIESLVDTEFEKRRSKIIDIKSVNRDAESLFGSVTFVGAGPGDPDLLTVKGLKEIKKADVILHDYLVSKEILSLVNRDTKIINCGKPHGSNNLTQEEINNKMDYYVREGKRVVRLKGGDPFVFGRLVEETEYLIANNIRFEIIPGITSSISGAGSAFIPVTARGTSNGFSVVSGCLKGNRFNDNWIELLKIPNHTTVVLMGLKKASIIVEKALRIGVKPNLPVAIISNATLPNQTEIFTTLENLASQSINVPTPAILVFGDVVNLRDKLKSNKNILEQNLKNTFEYYS
ncbi:MAG: uroporphyrinogen-III C-methyltransferase [Melioribacteraceae bacterium]|nr:uroporphyrinogen-III C-methyltransferase [Melioribacteraceae bacterium]